MEFYKRLDSLCKATGTSVTALLKSLNISTSKGTAWKNGSIPRADVLQKLATALHTTPPICWEKQMIRQKAKKIIPPPRRMHGNGI